MTGGGSIQVAGGQANFGFNARVKNGPSGHLTYQDTAGGELVQSTAITAVVVSGNTAQIFGTATVNGQGSFSFVATVEDNGEPGGGVDRFQIDVSDGYSSGAPVLLDDGGNIQIH